MEISFTGKSSFVMEIIKKNFKIQNYRHRDELKIIFFCKYVAKNKNNDKTSQFYINIQD